MSTNLPNHDSRSDDNSTLTASTPEAQQEAINQAPEQSNTARRWSWALLAGVIASVVVVGLIMVTCTLKPKYYRAEVFLKFSDKFSDNYHIVSSDDSSQNSLNQINAQAILIRSPLVLKTAIDNLDINKYPDMKDVTDPVNWISQRIRVNFPEPDIMSISLDGKDRNMVSDIVQAVIDAYMVEIVTADRENQLNRMKVLEEAYIKSCQQLDKKMLHYKELTDQIGSSDSDAIKQSSKELLATIDSLKTEIQNLDSKIAGINTRIELLRARLAVLPESEQPLDPEAQAQRQAKALEAATQQAVRQDPEIAKILQQIEYMNSRIEATRQAVEDPENSPKIQKMIDARDDMVKQLEERAKQLAPTIKEKLLQELADSKDTTPPSAAEKLQAAIDSELLDKSVYEKERETKFAQFTEAVHQAEKFDTFGFELENRKIELDRLREITNRMGAELQKWKIKQDAEPSVIELNSTPRIIELNSGA